MSDTPKTTLTQRRSQISTGAKKLSREKLGNSSGGGQDRTAVVRIVAWIAIVVSIGVGSALLLTNILSGDGAEDDASDTVAEATNEPESFPLDSVDADTDVDSDTDSGDTDVDDLIEGDSEGDIDLEPTDPEAVTEGDITTYSSTDRSRAGSGGSNIVLNNFSFFVENGEFNYVFKNITTTQGEIDPAAKLYYEGNNLVLELSNVATDNVTGNNNTTSRVINAVSGLTGTETENSGGVSKYRFLLTSKKDSKLVLDTANNEFRVKIQL